MSRRVSVPKYKRRGRTVKTYTRKKRPYPKKPIRKSRLKARTTKRDRFGRFVWCFIIINLPLVA